VQQFDVYQTYCGNQHDMQRTLERLKSSPTFAKFVQQCETTNSSLQKLTLSDLLVKPLHRITRYPLLFKRMLSHAPPNSATHARIDALVRGIEAQLAQVNARVRDKESRFKLAQLNDTLDFNEQVERFRIANDKRRLVGEKALVMTRVGQTLLQPPVPVTWYLFTDMSLLVTKPKKGDVMSLLRAPIPHEEGLLLGFRNGNDMRHAMLLCHLGPLGSGDCYTLQAMSAHDKGAWMGEVEEVMQDYRTTLVRHQYELMIPVAERYALLGHTVSQRAFDGTLGNSGGGGAISPAADSTMSLEDYARASSMGTLGERVTPSNSSKRLSSSLLRRSRQSLDYVFHSLNNVNSISPERAGDEAATYDEDGGVGGGGGGTTSIEVKTFSTLSYAGAFEEALRLTFLKAAQYAAASPTGPKVKNRFSLLRGSHNALDERRGDESGNAMSKAHSLGTLSPSPSTGPGLRLTPTNQPPGGGPHSAVGNSNEAPKSSVTDAEISPTAESVSEKSSKKWGWRWRREGTGSAFSLTGSSSKIAPAPDIEIVDLRSPIAGMRGGDVDSMLAGVSPIASEQAAPIAEDGKGKRSKKNRSGFFGEDFKF
jgi:hypothetical protein